MMVLVPGTCTMVLSKSARGGGVAVLALLTESTAQQQKAGKADKRSLKLQEVLLTTDVSASITKESGKRTKI